MNLFIGCSASNKIDDNILNDCQKLIKKIAISSDINLVYGAYNQGIMKICYDEFNSNNKKVFGVSPKIYADSYKTLDLEKLIITDTTMERFNEIYKMSDIFLFLPGGIGTYAELFNAIEENRTTNNKKLIIIYNGEYFYTPIIKELYELYKRHFINDSLTDYFIIESDVDEIIKLIEKEKEKWKN